MCSSDLEDQVSAALRAIADFREGTARQEGHIKSLESRITSSSAEIQRLESALADAGSRVESARKEFATLESEIAGLDASETGLDAEFEGCKSKLDLVQARFEKAKTDLIAGEKRKGAIQAKVDGLRQATLHKDGSGALLTNSRGIEVKGRDRKSTRLNSSH